MTVTEEAQKAIERLDGFIAAMELCRSTSQLQRHWDEWQANLLSCRCGSDGHESINPVCS